MKIDFAVSATNFYNRITEHVDQVEYDPSSIKWENDATPSGIGK